MATKLDNNILAAAIEGFEAQKKRLDTQIAELRLLMTGGTTEPAVLPQPGAGPRKVSAAGRKRMAAAQRKRWAAIKKDGASPKPAAHKSAKPKRKMSAEARQKISEANKKRWALVRAAAAKNAK